MLHHIFTAASWALGLLGVSGTLGAIGAVVGLGPAGALALFGPMLSRFLACGKCVAVVVFVGSTVGAYWVGRAGEYDRGYDAAVTEIAEENAATIAIARERRSAWRECRDAGRQWDQTNRRCL